MIIRVADNIYSPLGTTTAACFEQVKQGQSGQTYHEHLFDLPEACMVSLMHREALPHYDGCTVVESVAIASVSDALKQVDLDPSSPRVLFVVSTTKGNVHLLQEGVDIHDPRTHLAHTASVIARHFGNGNTPVVLSNACISGACAQIEAYRQLQAERYDTVIVVGVDMLSRFIISGFQSFKALSPQLCKPFDAHRIGLNLGEAAATIIYQRGETALPGQIELVCGSIHNDANHISGPSRTGEGSYLCLMDLLERTTPQALAFVNAHGTSTAYNDEMESIALTRAGITQTPINSLKGYFGHTLGAAGVLESIISMQALSQGLVLPSKGYEEKGVSGDIQISHTLASTTRRQCIKLLSGFGGCNAALLFQLHPIVTSSK